MGALIAFELTRQLRRCHLPMPQALFLAAYPAPHLPLSRFAYHDLPDPELIGKMEELGRVGAGLLEHPELAEYALPLLRADFEMCDTYRAAEEPPLDCAFVVLGGTADHHVSRDELAAWRVHTRGPFQMEMMPGNHFFLQSCRPLLLEKLCSHLEKFSRPAGRREGASSGDNRR